MRSPRLLIHSHKNKNPTFSSLPPPGYTEIHLRQAPSFAGDGPAFLGSLMGHSGLGGLPSDRAAFLVRPLPTWLLIWPIGGYP